MGYRPSDRWKTNSKNAATVRKLEGGSRCNISGDPERHHKQTERDTKENSRNGIGTVDPIML